MALHPRKTKDSAKKHEKVVNHFLEVVNLFIERETRAKSYGSDHLLHMSEVHAISTIGKHPDINAKRLAEIMGLTKGRITHLTRQLKNKGMLTTYKSETNSKEIYYQLTTAGNEVSNYHDNDEETRIQPILDYLDTLDQSKLTAIDDLFGVISEVLKKGRS